MRTCLYMKKFIGEIKHYLFHKTKSFKTSDKGAGNKQNNLKLIPCYTSSSKKLRFILCSETKNNTTPYLIKHYTTPKL